MSTSSMSRRLSQKTILITGASSGIGRSTALEFARTAPDCRLIVTARRVAALAELKSCIEKEFPGVSVLVYKLDVSNQNEVSGIVEKLPPGWREVDVLVNNAGLVKGVDQVGSISPTDIADMINTNIVGLISLTQEVLRSMLSRGGHGDILNVGSIAGRDGYAGGSIYCATKAAVRTFTEALRKEMVSTRVRIMEIDPGQVETEFSVVRFRGDKEKADTVYA
ncbi:NAD(P)-binding protein [Terfezia boudieri ATCC MYA-4762]|uniref:NAD(P)-binding protein n=1 Tax=Terfezia boudieri ATCC MYA-4762 TaxID=1051890 RepID=A0A3N4L9I6_9PEZI|nr:NAD(P)-binding protein [Terfezia boudieri ATCC MYA-4762]